MPHRMKTVVVVALFFFLILGIGEGISIPWGDEGNVKITPPVAAAGEKIQLSTELDDWFKNLITRLKTILQNIRQKVSGNSGQPKPKIKSNAPGSYTVVRGDSLSQIAKRFLGDPSRYMEIVELNKSRYPSLPKNPNLIYPGWVLLIPGANNTATKSQPKPTTPSGSTTTGSSSKDSAALNAWKGGKLSPSEFARLLGPAARESAKRTGVPASVTLAQAALETGWGRATIGDAKNLFGIKGTGPAGSITVPTKEYVNGRYITINGSFRKYNNWGESLDDHARLLSQGSRYRNAMANKNNPDQFARELQKAGYATSPTYAQTLISIMKSNNLYQFDK